jgi:hypothetical protein
MRLQSFARIAASFAVLAAAACSSDKPDDTTTLGGASMDTAMAEWKARQRSADSLISAAPSERAIVEQLGASVYKEAQPEVREAVLRESEKTRDCYTNARRDLDPNLSTVLYILANFGAAGWDLVRVEKSNFTSDAGLAVNACINSRAKTEWKLPMRGVRPGAHIVKIVYTPPDSSKNQ